MNQTIETIVNRRSVRGYDPRPIPKDVLDTIIACGGAGPSGANNKGWRFVVVQDPAFKRTLVEKTLPLYRKWLATMPDKFKEMRAEIDKSPDPIYYGAPVIVFVIGKGFTLDADCPMACQNMMLAARSLGIGSCWVYIGQLVTADPDVRQSLEIVPGEKVFGPIILGYPRDGFPPPHGSPPLPVKWI
jgi:nitroreductase